MAFKLMERFPGRSCPSEVAPMIASAQKGREIRLTLYRTDKEHA
jgi:hypothetical protein